MWLTTTGSLIKVQIVPLWKSKILYKWTWSKHDLDTFDMPNHQLSSIPGEFAVIIVIICLVVFFLVPRRKYRFPPGPPGLPILGNLLDFPKSHDWLTYQAWSEQYGMSYFPTEIPSVVVIDHFSRIRYRALQTLQRTCLRCQLG